MILQKSFEYADLLLKKHLLLYMLKTVVLLIIFMIGLYYAAQYFDQLNASFLNKSINFFGKKNTLLTKLLNITVYSILSITFD